MAPLFSAVSSSARQLLQLLRCISFAKTAQVRITPEGIRFTTEEGSAMEAFVLLEKSLFTTYNYNPPPESSSESDSVDPPVFEIILASLLETLNIFSLSDPNSIKRPSAELDSFAAHRLNRHAGINAFSHQALGMTGICTITYAGEGEPLSIHMAESGVTTVCDLTTYEAPSSAEEIPFNRDSLALKTILRSNVLLDSISELATLSPATITIHATPSSSSSSSNRSGGRLSLIATGASGSANVDFTTNTTSSTPILETFQCPAKTSASFQFAHVKAAQRAMAAATKVSLRLDDEGVLSLQFLVEVEEGANGKEAVAFVDFRIVPLVEGEGDESDGDEASEDGGGLAADSDE